YTQLFPPAPTFTEKNLLELSSKVYIITGATSGVGLELAKILYTLHATVYIGARSSSRFDTATAAIKAECTDSKGALKPFIADLASLRTIKPAVDAFLNEEYRLDVLFLNAGVMTPPAGSKTEDGFDLEFGVNCLAPFLLTSLLLPTLSRTSSHFCHPNTSIRVIWKPCLPTPSPATPTPSLYPSPYIPAQLNAMDHYMQTKAGAYLLAQEFHSRAHSSSTIADEHGTPSRNPAGVLHISLNPGFMKTELQRSSPAPMRGIMGAVFKGPKYGAYTELYAGLAPDVEDGDFVIPWGRKGVVPEHVARSTRVEGGGDGKSVGARFYEWCEVQVKPF
ncbi:NAD(P)-binding protein, partial [Byssothecium circinans]